MSHLRARFTLLIVSGVLLGSAVGTAQASAMTVTVAIKTQDKVIKNAAAYKSLTHLNANTPAEARKLIVEFKALREHVAHAATVVAGASANGTKEKQGQKDWVTGARDLASGIGMLDTGLQDVVKGNAAAAKAVLRKAQLTLSRADAVAAKADKLLGLPTSD